MVFDKIEKIYCFALYMFYVRRKGRGGLIPEGCFFCLHVDGLISRGSLIKLRVCFFMKIQDWILKSEKEFCASLLNRLIQDNSDHGASTKEPKNPCPEWILRFL